MTKILAVRHNIEVAHRLYMTPGQCEQIHGHSMWVQLEIYGGQINENGIYEGINYTDLKRAFCGFLDEEFDHRLLLNKDDPWSHKLSSDTKGVDDERIPGLQITEGDPTTENIANWISAWAVGWLVDACPDTAATQNVSAQVWETSVNMAQVIR